MNPRVMQSVPWVMVLSEHFKVAMREILAGTEANSEVRAATRLEVVVVSAEDDSVQTSSGRERESSQVGVPDRGIP